MVDCASHDRAVQLGSVNQSRSFSTPIAFTRGTGETIYTSLLIPAILDAKHEVILVTCFWAPSATLDALVATLRQLSARILNTPNHNKIKVYICLSSRSAAQKLFHTSSPSGYAYPSKRWTEKLGLPPPSELLGLDIVVKSLFFRPFSVLHSKYVIIDRQHVYLPSCNVSWEDWYECCIGLEGPIVQHVFDFWDAIWKLNPVPLPILSRRIEIWEHAVPCSNISISKGHFAISNHELRTTLLPHPHDSSIRQSLWLLRKQGTPQTPLNTKLVTLITQARSSIVMLTPNFTAQPACLALCIALRNGVDVHIITDRRMMVPEQLVTAGTITERYIDKLIKEYKTSFQRKTFHRKLERFLTNIDGAPAPRRNSVMIEPTSGSNDLDCGEGASLGKLRVSYFRRPLHDLADPETNKNAAGFTGADCDKSHIKLTLVDQHAIVLGSGNMDRASWTTSQELGVLIEDEDEVGRSTGLVRQIWEDVEIGLRGCLESYFQS